MGNEESLNLDNCQKCVDNDTLYCEIYDDYCSTYDKLCKLDKERFDITHLKSKEQFNTIEELEL